MATSSSLIKPGGQVQNGSVVVISASAKPAPGRHERSAVRNYAGFMVERLLPNCSDTRLLDLRTVPLPAFDGRLPEDIEDRNVETAYHAICAAGGLLFAVPAYWQSVGAVFKNFCEVMAGPAYDLDGVPTVFAGKPASLLVVGADTQSAQCGATDATRILAALGAEVMADPVIVSNPRKIVDEAAWAALAVKLVGLAGRTALAARLEPASP